MRRLLVLAGLAIVAGGVAAANLGRSPGAVRVDWRLVRATPRGVAAESPTRGPIARVVAAPGVVEPAREARVAPRTAGRVERVYVEEGDEVCEGDMLVALESGPRQARLDAARARIKAAKETLPKADAAVEAARVDKEALDRAVAAHQVPDAGLAASPSRLASATANREGWRREQAMAEAEEEAARVDLDRADLRAPMDGTVESVAVAVGDEVAPTIPGAPPGPPLVTLFDPARLRVRVLADEADVALLRPGQRARVFLAADPDAGLTGRVERVAARGRSAGASIGFPTLLAVDDPARRLRAGMRVNAEVEVSRAERALGVPIQAVLHRRRGDLPDTEAVRAWSGRRAGSSGVARYATVVFVVEGGVARLRPIETGVGDDRRVEVVWGLAAVERVVVGPLHVLEELADGAPVVPEATGAGP